DVLTRCYADGNAVILDLRERKNEPRVLALDFNGYKTVFVLWAGGCVVVGPDGVTPGAVVSAFPKSVGIGCDDWKLSLDRPNILCPEFNDERTLILTVKEGVGDVVFMLRRYGEEASATLGSEEIVVSKVPDALPQGLNELYLQSIPIVLKLTEGEHVLQLKGDAEEYPYLPGVFLAGNFAVEATDVANGKMTIRSLPKDVPYGDLTVKGLRNYAGRVILEKTVHVPEDAAFIRLDTNDLCADVLLDDTILGVKVLPSFISSKSLGAKAWAPFIWPVPKEKRGKTMKLSVILDAPVSAIFGRERFSKMKAGLYTPPATDGAIGIFAADWLLDEPTH
ncbi:MAG: hypothetical protein J6W23_14245, partial [Victivallales bacterium]|nr:hypothetical protein [Victivallales bacterium]